MIDPKPYNWQLFYDNYKKKKPSQRMPFEVYLDNYKRRMEVEDLKELGYDAQRIFEEIWNLYPVVITGGQLTMLRKFIEIELNN